MEVYHQLRYYPFFRFLIPYMGGIVFSVFLQVSLLIPSLMILFSILFLVTGIHKKYSRRWIFGVALSFFLFSAAMLQTGLIVKNLIPENLPLREEYYKAVVLDPPEQKKKSKKTVLRILSIDESNNILKGYKILAYFKKDAVIEAGDVLLVRSHIQEIPGPKNPFELNYRRRMFFKGIIFRTYIGDSDFVKTGTRSSPKIWASKVRNRIIENYRRSGLKGNELAVLAALTVGTRDEIPVELTRSYSATGIVHILSVSGLHVGIIYMVLNFLLRFLNHRRYGTLIKLVIIIISLWTFALIAGFKTSAVRAAFMFSIMQIGISSKRHPDVYNTIGVSAFFILLVNPLQIADVGFQLSYLAVLGIVTFQKPVYSWMVFRNYLADKIWLIMSVSVAAQAATFPLTIFYFHQFPVYFWLTNIFAIPLTAAITYSGAVLSVLSLFGTTAGRLFAWIPSLLIRFLNGTVEIIENLPFSTIGNINTDVIQMVLIFILLSLFSLFAFTSVKKYLSFFLVFALVLISYGSVKNQFFLTAKKLTVYNTPGNTAFSIIEGKRSWLVHSFKEEEKVTFYTGNHLLRKGTGRNSVIIREDQAGTCFTDEFYFIRYEGNGFFYLNGMKGVLLKERIESDFSRKLNLDYILLSGNPPVKYEDLCRWFTFKTVILDASNSVGYMKYWEKQAIPDSVRLFSLKEDHAFEMNL